MSAYVQGKDRKSRPLACWPKLKEVRRQSARDVWDAAKQGRPIALGLLVFTPSLAGAFNAANLTYGPNLGKILEDERLLTRYNELAEEKGFGPDLCGNGRIQLATMFNGTHNVNPVTGETIMPTFGLDIYSCGEQGKLQREFCAHYGIESFDIEIPTLPGRDEYFIQQMFDTIEAIEKYTGLKCDDEKLIECVYNEFRTKVLMAKIANLQKTIPAPLDMKTVMWLVSMLQNAKAYQSDVVEALKDVLAETEDRVANHISAIGEERARLQIEGQNPWYTYGEFGSGFMQRCAIEYGAVTVGSYSHMCLNSAWDTAADGTITPAKTLEEKGVVLKNRDDAVRHLSDLYLNHCGGIRYAHEVACTNKGVVKFVKDWHTDAVIMNLDRSCHPSTMMLLERRIALQEAGVPCMVYEAPHCDPREINMSEIRSRLETFMETLGLKKL